MIFENVDVQWTVICRSSIKSALRGVQVRAKSLKWSFNNLEVKDSDGVNILSREIWPRETFGSASYCRQDSLKNYSLFWSTYTNTGLSKITGGLYIHQYANGDPSFLSASYRAHADLRQMFNGEEILCVVLALEDDEGIDVAPGIIGSYRPSLWQALHSLPLDGLVQKTREGWVDVYPVLKVEDRPLSVFAMPERTMKAIKEIQSALTAEIWGG